MRDRTSMLHTLCGIVAACGFGAASAHAEDEPAPPASRGTLLVMYEPSLQDTLDAWAAYRTADGWRVITQEVPLVDGESSTGNKSARALRETIRQHWRASAANDPSRFMVLLLGDAPASSESDYRGIPAWRFSQTDADMQLPRDRTYITDHPYQLMDDADDLPDIPLGRIPARTNAEALAALHKVKAYESTGAGAAGCDRITYVAGEGHYGLMDNVLESMFKTMVDQLVPPAFDVSMTYAKPTSIYCPPPSKLSDTVLERLGEGCLLFNYVGHGYERGFDSLIWGSRHVPILRVDDLSRLGQFAAPDAQLAIALLTCCSTGWFDLPGEQHCLAEAMLFDAGAAGPVAVIAGSRVTHPYANIIVQKDVTSCLLKDRVSTLGMLDLLAARSLMEIDEQDRQIDALVAPVALAGEWKTSLTNLRRMHMSLYNLLGDPAMKINVPFAAIENLTLNGLQISGTVPGMVEGVAHISVETARTSFARPGEIKVVSEIPEGDPEMNAKAAHNYPLARNRVLIRAEASVRDGRFEATLPAAPTPAAAVVRVLAHGTSRDGKPCDAIGSLSLTSAAPAPQ